MCQDEYRDCTSKRFGTKWRSAPPGFYHYHLMLEAELEIAVAIILLCCLSFLSRIFNFGDLAFVTLHDLSRNIMKKYIFKITIKKLRQIYDDTVFLFVCKCVRSHTFVAGMDGWNLALVLHGVPVFSSAVSRPSPPPSA